MSTGGIAYSFGTGHDPPTGWTSPADVDLDGDGVLDGVALDFDGDGRVDDALWDSDGDGVADRSVLDLDDDGTPEHAYRDPAGLGTWTEPATAPSPAAAPDPAAAPSPDPATPHERSPGNPPGAAELKWHDTAGVAHTSTISIDSDGDGRADVATVDADRDGRSDDAVGDSDGDGVSDLVLVDTDDDGRMETAYTDTDGDGEPDTKQLRAGRGDLAAVPIAVDRSNHEACVREGRFKLVPGAKRERARGHDVATVREDGVTGKGDDSWFDLCHLDPGIEAIAVAGNEGLEGARTSPAGPALGVGVSAFERDVSAGVQGAVHGS